MNYDSHLPRAGTTSPPFHAYLVKQLTCNSRQTVYGQSKFTSRGNAAPYDSLLLPSGSWIVNETRVDIHMELGMVTLIEDHQLMVQRFKFLDLVQAVAAADVAQAVEAVGVDALAAIAGGGQSELARGAPPNFAALPRQVRQVLQRRSAAAATAAGSRVGHTLPRVATLAPLRDVPAGRRNQPAAGSVKRRVSVDSVEPASRVQEARRAPIQPPAPTIRTGTSSPLLPARHPIPDDPAAPPAAEERVKRDHAAAMLAWLMDRQAGAAATAVQQPQPKQHAPTSPHLYAQQRFMQSQQLQAEPFLATVAVGNDGGDWTHDIQVGTESVHLAQAGTATSPMDPAGVAQAGRMRVSFADEGIDAQASLDATLRDRATAAAVNRTSKGTSPIFPSARSEDDESPVLPVSADASQSPRHQHHAASGSPLLAAGLIRAREASPKGRDAATARNRHAVSFLPVFETAQPDSAGDLRTVLRSIDSMLREIDVAANHSASAEATELEAERLLRAAAEETARAEAARVVTTAATAPAAKAPRRQRGRIPAEMVRSIRQGRDALVDYAAFQERLWNTSAMNQYAFGDRFAGALFDDLLDEVVDEMREVLDDDVEEVLHDEVDGGDDDGEEEDDEDAQ
jgi:hypothetical protein